VLPRLASNSQSSWLRVLWLQVCGLLKTVFTEVFSIFFFFFGGTGVWIQGFRYLQSRCSTAWATPPFSPYLLRREKASSLGSELIQYLQAIWANPAHT
jgi:hypothetical protein